MSALRVVVVEDDHGLRDVLARGLRAEDFEVLTASDGEAALRLADSSVDVIVLDIGLPDSDGRDVCQALRARGIDAPVIFLTARGGLGDRLSGFASGADDYLAKPFAFAELVARLHAVMRRRPRAVVSTVDDLVVDPVGLLLRRRDQSVRLSPTEYRLLARLIGSKGELVRRAQLKAAAWPDGAIVSDNTLDQYIVKLRRRLTVVAAQATIEVVRGVGYELS